ncbi:hypothetical protein [Streptomyces sp. NPDC102360]|uniref:hypothetical protein n=1 Tax=Streptomyces sp. NPDC102360 TaxID=3366160 RepID=UPI0038177059
MPVEDGRLGAVFLAEGRGDPDEDGVVFRGGAFFGAAFVAPAALASVVFFGAAFFAAGLGGDFFAAGLGADLAAVFGAAFHRVPHPRQDVSVLPLLVSHSVQRQSPDGLAGAGRFGAGRGVSQIVQAFAAGVLYVSQLPQRQLAVAATPCTAFPRSVVV